MSELAYNSCHSDYDTKENPNFTKLGSYKIPKSEIDFIRSKVQPKATQINNSN